MIKKNKYYEKRICLIGTGKVGSILFHSLKSRGFKFSYVIDSNIRRAKTVTAKYKDVRIASKITKEIISESDVIALTVQDANLKISAGEIGKLETGLSGKIFFHTSGAETSDIFSELKVQKGYSASFHPLQTFNKISYNNNNILNNIYYGIEGGKEAVNFLKFLAESLDSKYIILPKSKKILYHSACVMASNFLVTHFNVLSKLSKEISESERIKIFEPIVRTTINNIFTHGTEKSLTGPFARGDIKTIEMHLKDFEKNIPSYTYYYVMMGLETLNLSYGGKKIDRKTAKKIEKLLLNYI